LTLALYSRSQPRTLVARMLLRERRVAMVRRYQQAKDEADRVSAERRSRSLRLFVAQWAKRHMPERVQFRRRRAS
jgi:hypothetical protein